MNRSIICLLSVFVILNGCSSNREGAEKSDYNYLLETTRPIKPEFQVFHSDNDSSILYFKVNTQNLLYAKRSSDSDYKAKVKISYTCHLQTEEGEIVDQGEFQMEDTDQERKEKSLIGSAVLNIKRGSNYILKLNCFDVNRQNQEQVTIHVNKSDLTNRQNFMVSDGKIDVPLFSDRIKLNQQYHIEHPTDATIIYGRYYNREFALPPPPYSMYNHKPFDFSSDSLFYLEQNENGKFIFKAGQEGFYHFQSDSATTSGLSLFTYREPFPEISTVEELVGPMRFILTPREYRAIAESDDPKAALERQWISWTGNKEEARDAIKSYYHRIEECNSLFTSFTEGWKTDRGLIYLIYGKPNHIYKSEFYENWVYGENSSPNSIRFTFLKVQNPFTENDYRLDRNETYKPSWYRAVESWRTGKYYLFN